MKLIYNTQNIIYINTLYYIRTQTLIHMWLPFFDEALFLLLPLLILKRILMTELEHRCRDLRDRVKRKREEVVDYLNQLFYTKCWEILGDIRRLDVKGVFEKDPSFLPHYRSNVQTPMFWKAIASKLEKYKYTSSSLFIDDMRLVLDNCYAYNGTESPISTVARDIEIVMEDLFVKVLGVLPPKKSEILELGSKLSKQASLEVWHMWCLYEKKDANHTGKAQLSLHTCSCATQRRILALLRKARESKPKEQHTRRPASMPVKRPQPKPPAPAAPSNAILQTDDTVSFHEEAPSGGAPKETDPALERVPQNARSGFAVRELSPVRMDESSCSDDSEFANFVRSD